MSLLASANLLYKEVMIRLRVVYLGIIRRIIKVLFSFDDSGFNNSSGLILYCSLSLTSFFFPNFSRLLSLSYSSSLILSFFCPYYLGPNSKSSIIFFSASVFSSYINILNPVDSYILELCPGCLNTGTYLATFIAS